jgi:hypothetical protein
MIPGPPQTVSGAIEEIRQGRYVLPAIQRSFVWDYEQIELLFDSLLQGYPLGQLLLWRLELDPTKEYALYQFLRDFHRRDSTQNPPAKPRDREVMVVLDGQQRLTALYIGLLGSFTTKWKWMRADNPDAWSKMNLYLNLEGPLLVDEEESRRRFDFRFLGTDELKDESGKHWFRVGQILDMDLGAILGYLRANGLSENAFALQTASQLHDVIRSRPVLPYALYVGNDEERALDIFLRANNTGTPLNYSDLLMSIATSNWKQLKAREEIPNLERKLNEGLDDPRFTKDFVLKSALTLTDTDPSFRVGNFKPSNVSKMEENWKAIRKALLTTVRLARELGFDSENLPTTNVLIPVAYFLYSRNVGDEVLSGQIHAESRFLIRQWLARAILKRVFGGQSDTLLRRVREKVKGSGKTFPLSEIRQDLAGTAKSLEFTDADLDSILDYTYDSWYAYSVLALLVPSAAQRERFHIDHLHARAQFSRSSLKRAGVPMNQIDTYQQAGEQLGNLHLMEARPNIAEKSGKPLAEWLEEAFPSARDREAYMRSQLIPLDVPLDIGHLPEFVEARRRLMKLELARIVTTSADRIAPAEAR